MESIRSIDYPGQLRFGCFVLVVSKTKHSKTKTEARSTQISKTKHPRSKTKHPKTRKRRPLNLENEAPKTRNHRRFNNYNFTSCMTQSCLSLGVKLIQAFDIRSMKYHSTACLCWYFSGLAGIFFCVISFSRPSRADSPFSKKHFSSWLYGYSHAAAEMHLQLE